MKQVVFLRFFYLLSKECILREIETLLPFRMYYCAAANDISVLDALERHLAPIKQEGWLETWHEREAQTGGNWEQERVTRLDYSQLVVALVSPQLFSDKSCFLLIEEALARHRRGQTVFLPVLVQAIDLQNAPFRSLSSLPSNGVPIMSWPNPSEGLAQTAVEIRQVVEVLHRRLDLAAHPVTPFLASPSISPQPPILTPAELGEFSAFTNAYSGFATVPSPMPPSIPSQPTVVTPQSGPSFARAYSGLPTVPSSIPPTIPSQPTVVTPQSGPPFTSAYSGLPTVPSSMSSSIPSQPMVVPPYSNRSPTFTDGYVNSPATLYSASPGIVPPTVAVPYPSEPANVNAVEMSDSTATQLVQSGKVARRQPRSRRTVLLGLAGLGGVAALGIGGFLFFRSHPVQPFHTIKLNLPLPIIYHGHTDFVTSIAWSPDGKRLASAGADKTVRIWDLTANAPIFTYFGHSGAVLSVAWSPDGKRLASAGADKTVHIWDLHSKQAIFTYSGHSDTVNSVAWSQDKKRLASASADKTVQIWDLHSAQPLFIYRGHKNTVTSVGWSADGRRLASSSADKTAQIWDLHSAQPLFTYSGHQDIVTNLAWSPDGKRVASASADKTAQVWDTHSTKALYTYPGHYDIVTGIIWSPDGKQLASASADKTVQIWALHAKRASFIYYGHSDIVTSLDWSSDGKTLASGSHDNTVQVWNTDVKQPTPTATATATPKASATPKKKTTPTPTPTP
jgi:WD40 repeat protein